MKKSLIMKLDIQSIHNAKEKKERHLHQLHLVQTIFRNFSLLFIISTEYEFMKSASVKHKSKNKNVFEQDYFQQQELKTLFHICTRNSKALSIETPSIKAIELTTF